MPLTVFHLFPNLPAELRNQIWNDALPELRGPFLFFYTTESWKIYGTTRSADIPNPRRIRCEFRKQGLYSLKIKLPLARTNHESRSVATAWLADHGFKTYQDEDNTGYVFARWFDVGRDVLYVSPDMLYEL